MTQSSNINTFDVIASLSPLESPRARQQRAALGAFYGLLGGTAYVLTVALINPLTFPGLPLQIDPLDLAGQWALFGLGLAALGALAAWPSAGWHGIGGGALASALLILIINLQSGRGSWLTGGVIMLFMILPVMVMCLPIPMTLRWMARKAVAALNLRGRPMFNELLWWGVLALLLGLVPGLFGRMSVRAEQSVRQIQTLMQTAAARPAEAELTGALKALPNVRPHLGQPYGLSQTNSRISTEGFDVRVFFADGYVFTCVVVVYPGANQQPFVRNCVEEREARP